MARTTANRRARFRSGAVIAFVLLAAHLLAPVSAQTWKPAKPVELIVPAAAGGGTDVTARVVQHVLTDRRLIDVASIVVNKPGGAGGVAYTYVAQRRGDAHSLLFTYPSLLTNHIVGTSSLKHTDLTPIAQLLNTYIGFSVRADSPLKTAADLLDRLRKDPAAVVFGTFALGAGTHLAVAMVAKSVGADPRRLKVVIFPSGAQSQAALLGGHVDVVPTGVSNLVGQARDGRLRVLAVTSPRRLDGVLPNVPTWKELGVDVVIGQWRGVMGPPAMTAGQQAYWEDVMARLVKTDEWKAELRRTFDEDDYMNAAETGRFLEADYAELKAVLTELGLVRQK